MNPSLSVVADRVAALIRDEAVPALGATYAGGQLMRGALLLQAAVHDFEHGAAWRVDEVGALQALLARAAPEVDDQALAAALRAIVPAPPADLRISALDAQLTTLRTLLTDLHAWTETSSAAAAQRLNAEVWHELRAGTERRRLDIGHF